MKYCTHCGKEMVDEAVVCPNCGCAADNSNSVSKSDDRETIRTVAKIFMIIGCIAGASCFLIPLAWCIPMTVHYWKKVEAKESVSTSFKVCSLLFVNLVAGILMLCDGD